MGVCLGPHLRPQTPHPSRAPRCQGPSTHTVSLFHSSVKGTEHIGTSALHEQSQRYIRVQDINEQRVVLEEVVGLETAAITNSKVRKEFAVVGCEGSGGQKRGYTHALKLVIVMGCVTMLYN